MKNDVVKRIVILLLLIYAFISFINTSNFAFADENEYYIICKPEGEVNVREKPKLKSPIVGCLFFGDLVETDGKEKNGFVHVINLNAETDTGWIYGGLLVRDKPIVSPGHAQVFKAERVALRKYATRDSKVKKWLKEGENVMVLAISEEWCVTEDGYVMTEFLTLNKGKVNE